MVGLRLFLPESWTSSPTSANTIFRICPPIDQDARRKSSRRAVDLRTRAPAAEGGTRPQPLGGEIIDGATPTRVDDDGHLRQSRRLSAAGWKKGVGDRCLNQACPPSGMRSSTSSQGCDRAVDYRILHAVIASSRTNSNQIPHVKDVVIVQARRLGRADPNASSTRKFQRID